MLRVYVAAPFLDAPQVRALDDELASLEIACASRWARSADGPEALDTLAVNHVRRIARANDRDLLSAHLVVALAREGAGAEMFAEVRLAIAHRIPVLWVGTRRPLSAYREGVMRAETLSEAKVYLLGFSAIVRGLAPHEKRHAREVLWGVVEGTDDKARRPTPPRLHVVH